MDMCFYTSILAFPRDFIVDHEIASEAQVISWRQLAWLLSGLVIEQPKAIQT